MINQEYVKTKWMLFYNGSGVTIPAFGCFKAYGNDTIVSSGIEIAITAVTPDGQPGSIYFLNGPVDVPAGATGNCCNPTNVWAFASFTGFGGSLVAWNDTFGPIAGSFALSLSGEKTFTYAGYYDSGTQKIAVVAKTPDAVGTRIHFVINSVNYGGSYAVCTILEKTCGATLKGLNSDGSVTVYDTAGCWLNSPGSSAYTDCNLGRHGYADYMEIYGYPGTCRWIISSMCPAACVLVLKDIVCNGDGTITKTQTKVAGCC